MRNRTLLIFGAALSIAVTAWFARAQNPALDDIDVRIEEGIAEVHIRMTFPVRYLRHFPANHGQQLEIAFQIAALNPYEVSLNEEVRKVSATAAVPGFTVTYLPPRLDNVTTDPATLLVRFDRAVNFQVSGSDDKEGINVYIPITPAETGHVK